MFCKQLARRGEPILLNYPIDRSLDRLAFERAQIQLMAEAAFF
jgi:hypothetical protein